MTRCKFGIAIGLLAVMLVTCIAPMGALASTQSNKNLWRNLAIGSAAVGGLGLLNHNSTLGILGIAGAAYSANRYEQERHAQSVRRAERERWYREHHDYRR